MASDPCLTEQSCVNLKDALRRLHIRDYNGNLKVGMLAFFIIWKRLPRIKWQIYAYALQVSLLFQVAIFGFN